MARGGGKYDEEANALQRGLDADAVIVIVIGGERGNGGSVCADLDTMMQLPKVLRLMAEQIEVDIVMELAERNN